MLKLSKLALSISACLVITACGGSGGDGNGNGDAPTSKASSSLGVVVNTGNTNKDNEMTVCLDVSGKGDCSCESEVSGLSFKGKDGLLSWDDDDIALCQSNATADTATALNGAKVIAVNSKSKVYLGYTIDKIEKTTEAEKTKYEKLYLNPLSALQDSLGSAHQVVDTIGLPVDEAKDDFSKVSFSEYGDITKVTLELIVDAGVMDKATLDDSSKAMAKVENSYKSVDEALNNSWGKDDIAGWLSQNQDASNPFDDVAIKGSEGKDVYNNAPKAEFNYDNKNGFAVQFTNVSSDVDGDKLTYVWKFGDGEVSTEESPLHTYANNTQLLVELSVCDAKNACDRATHVVSPIKCVENCEENKAPVAAFTAVEKNGTVTFTNTSSDANGDALTYTWDFGDGTTATKNDNKSFTHVYNQVGNFTVKLVANDGTLDSQVATKTVNVTCIGASCEVQNTAPVAMFEVSVSGQNVTITNSSSDPDGDTISSTWNFGDGKGDLKNNSSKFTYAFDKEGTYTITLKVSDGKLSAEKTQSVTIGCAGDNCGTTNQNPVADFTYTVAEGKVTFNNNSSDPDGDAIKSSWDFGTGETLQNNNKTFVYPLSVGVHKVTLTVTDGNGGSATKTVDVNVPCFENCGDNTAPVAQFSALVGNDGVVTFTNTSSDKDGDALTTTWDFGDGAAAVVNNNKSFTKTMAPGSYTVKITVSDGKAEATYSTSVVVTATDSLKCTLD